MQLAFLQTCTEDQLRQTEISSRVEWYDRALAIDDLVQMGAHSFEEKRWKVVRANSYEAISLGQSLSRVDLIHVHPDELPVPLESDWEAISFLRDYPDTSLYIELSPDSSIISYGYQMNGGHPVGRLYGSEPTDHPTLLKPVPLPWTIDQIDTYKPIGSGSYTAIHICHCTPVSLPELTVA